jgi:hypothetical protein
LKATKKHLLKHAIATAPLVSSQPPAKQLGWNKARPQKPSSKEAMQLPPELLDLLMVIPPFLDRGHSMRADDLELLLSSPPFSDFATILPQLSRYVSSHLTTQARGLARVMHPTTNPSFIHRAIPHMFSTTEALLSTISSNRAALTSTRLAATGDVVHHLNKHTESLLLLLRALEDKHGIVAQSSMLRASDASLEAKLWAASMGIFLSEARANIYPPESQMALRNYQRHLRDAQMQLSNKLRTREQELGEYGVFISTEEGGLGIGRADKAREHRLREMARVRREMENRLKEINGDLMRLDGS